MTSHHPWTNASGLSERRRCQGAWVQKMPFESNDRHINWKPAPYIKNQCPTQHGWFYILYAFFLLKSEQLKIWKPLGIRFKEWHCFHKSWYQYDDTIWRHVFPSPGDVFRQLQVNMKQAMKLDEVQRCQIKPKLFGEMHSGKLTYPLKIGAWDSLLSFW